MVNIMREFKIKNIKYRIVNRYTGNCEINEYNKKYNLLSFNQILNGWTRVASCNTIEEGKRIAEEI